MSAIEFTEAGDPVFRSVRVTRTPTIGSRLRSERKRMGLSQTAFAELGGVSRKAQHRYEQDERAPDVRYISRIAQAGADVLFIITGVRAEDVSRQCRAVAAGVSRSQVRDACAVSEPRPWVAIENPEDIRAFVASASEAELSELAGLIRTGASPDPVVSKALVRIATAVNADEGLVRKMMAAAGSMERRRGQSRDLECRSGIRP